MRTAGEAEPTHEGAADAPAFAWRSIAARPKA